MTSYDRKSEGEKPGREATEDLPLCPGRGPTLTMRFIEPRPVILTGPCLITPHRTGLPLGKSWRARISFCRTKSEADWSTSTGRRLM